MFRSLLTLLVVSGSAFASNPDPQSLVVSKDDQAKAKTLVERLGDPKFTVRETAYQELSGMGRKALSSLAAGASDSPDAEVRLRCRKLIPAARSDDFQARLDTFLADTEAKFKHDLPGLDTFFTATGKNEAARKLYLDLLKSDENRKLLVESEGDKTGLAAAVSARAYDLYRRQYPSAVVVNGQVVQPTTTGRPTYLDVLALLIVDTEAPADTKTPRRNITYSPAYSMQVVQEFRTEAMATTPSGEVIRKVIGKWLDTRTEVQDLYYGMNFLTNSNQKDEAIRAAKKLLELKATPSSYRGMAIITISKQGGPEAVGLLLNHLTDDTLCVTMTRNNNKIEIQTRDVALAALVSLTQQKVGDYGFQTLNNTANVVSYSTQWFDSDTDRKKGMEKWAEWAKANPKAVEVKKEKK